jgi:hypothetical protein
MSTFINIGIVHINLDQVLRIVDDKNEITVYYTNDTTDLFLEEDAKALRTWLSTNSKAPTAGQKAADAYMRDKPQNT